MAVHGTRPPATNTSRPTLELLAGALDACSLYHRDGSLSRTNARTKNAAPPRCLGKGRTSFLRDHGGQ